VASAAAPNATPPMNAPGHHHQPQQPCPAWWNPPWPPWWKLPCPPWPPLPPADAGLGRIVAKSTRKIARDASTRFMDILLPGSISEEERQVLGEQHALVEDDLAPRDQQAAVHAAQHILTLAHEHVGLGLDAVTVDEKSALDRDLGRGRVGGAGTEDLD